MNIPLGHNDDDDDGDGDDDSGGVRTFPGHPGSPSQPDETSHFSLATLTSATICRCVWPAWRSARASSSYHALDVATAQTGWTGWCRRTRSGCHRASRRGWSGCALGNSPRGRTLTLSRKNMRKKDGPDRYKYSIKLLYEPKTKFKKQFYGPPQTPRPIEF